MTGALVATSLDLKIDAAQNPVAIIMGEAIWNLFSEYLSQYQRILPKDTVVEEYTQFPTYSGLPIVVVQDDLTRFEVV